MTDDDDLRTQLDELERTLEALREQVDGDGDRWRDDRRRRRPRPPSPLELLRFTETHTIPTLVSTLEATIRTLELVGGLLRLVDPAASEDGRRPVPPGTRATVGRALSDLRSALDGTTLPDDPAARDLVADARELAADVEARLDDSRTGDSPRDERVDVRDGGDADDSPDVDVESELDSIRDELRDDEE
ncbi:MAG: hypothetical protein ABEJ78_10610 [Haloferacaceae archaeon]